MMRQTWVRNNLKITVHPFVLSQVSVVQFFFFSEERCYGTLALDVSSNMFIPYFQIYFTFVVFYRKIAQNCISWCVNLHSDYFS